MSKWKMVPVEPTREMINVAAVDLTDEQFYEAMLDAAPAWEPSDELCIRTLDTFWNHPGCNGIEAMRAALKAAVGGG